MLGLKLHLPAFDQLIDLPGYQRLILTDRGRGQLAQLAYNESGSPSDAFSAIVVITFRTPVLFSEEASFDYDRIGVSSYPGYSSKTGDWLPTAPIGPLQNVVAGQFTPWKVTGETTQQVHGAALLLGGDFIAGITLDEPIDLPIGRLIPLSAIVT